MRRELIAALAAGLLVVVVGDRCHSVSLAEWETRVERVQEQARHQRERAKQAEAEADSLSEAAGRALRAAESAEARIRAQVDTVRAETPPELREHPAIVQRDSLIGGLLDESTRLRRAFDLQRQASARLRAALASEKARGDSLSAVLEDRPGDRPWFLPRLGLGVAAGLDSRGLPNTVAGLTVSWEVRF